VAFAILPVEYIAIGIRGGAAFALTVFLRVQELRAPVTAMVACATVRPSSLPDGSSHEPERRDRVRSLAIFLRGRNALLFWIGVVAIGVVVPAILVIVSYPVPSAARAFSCRRAVTGGDLLYKYCMNDGHLRAVRGIARANITGR